MLSQLGPLRNKHAVADFRQRTGGNDVCQIVVDCFQIEPHDIVWIVKKIQFAAQGIQLRDIACRKVLTGKDTVLMSAIAFDITGNQGGCDSLTSMDDAETIPVDDRFQDLKVLA